MESRKKSGRGAGSRSQARDRRTGGGDSGRVEALRKQLEKLQGELRRARAEAARGSRTRGGSDGADTRRLRGRLQKSDDKKKSDKKKSNKKKSDKKKSDKKKIAEKKDDRSDSRALRFGSRGSSTRFGRGANS